MDMLSRLSQLYREKGDHEKAVEYAMLTKQVYDLFADRAEGLSFNTHEQTWLNETIWQRLGE